MNIVITDDSLEMVRIGRETVEEKRTYYTDEVLASIRAEIKHRIPDGTPEETEAILYKTVYLYWAYGFTTDEYFYFELDNKPHAELKLYVSKKEKILYLNQINRIDDAHILQNKYETYEYFREFFKRDMVYCDGEECYDAFREYVAKHPVFVVKPLKLGGGKGVRRESVLGLSEAQIKEKFKSLLYENSELNRRMNSWGGKSAFVLEELIEQTEELAALHSQSVNVVRVPTIRIGERIIVYQPWLKIGCGDSFVDNAHAGGLLAGINAETGIIDSQGASEFPRFYEYHPDSNIRIPGFRIPRWDELLDIAKTLSEKLTSIRYIGWDLALTKNGWVVVEGNFRGEFDWQIFRRRGMKAEFEALTGLRLEKEFWWQ